MASSEEGKPSAVKPEAQEPKTLHSNGPDSSASAEQGNLSSTGRENGSKEDTQVTNDGKVLVLVTVAPRPPRDFAHLTCRQIEHLIILRNARGSGVVCFMRAE
jgi:hypothetical protein